MTEPDTVVTHPAIHVKQCQHCGNDMKPSSNGKKQPFVWRCGCRHKRYKPTLKPGEAYKGQLHYLANKARLAEQRRQFRKNNPEKVAARNKKWQMDNREKVKAAIKRYRKTEKGKITDTNYRHRRRAVIHGSNARVSPKQLREFLLSAKRCHYCSTPFGKTRATPDHVIPISRGGPHCLTNIVACCRRCNHHKQGMPPEKWAAQLGLLLI